MIELFHCRPSDLDEEDGFRCLRLLNVQHWRDAAIQYKSDPKRMDASTRMRLSLLMAGEEDALDKYIEAPSQTQQVANLLREVGQTPAPKSAKEIIEKKNVRD